MSEGVLRPARKLQFTIAQALLATAFIGVCTGYAVNYGVATAVAFGVLTSLLWIQFVRTRRRWNTLVLWQRAYGCVITGALVAALITFVARVAWGAPFVREHNARHLQRVLNGDSRFSSVHVQHLDLKGSFLRVDGQVNADRDFDALRDIVMAYDWRTMGGILWNVTVRSSERVYHGWDSQLFGDAGQDGAAASVPESCTRP